jgi:hypothetical protein
MGIWGLCSGTVEVGEKGSILEALVTEGDFRPALSEECVDTFESEMEGLEDLREKRPIVVAGLRLLPYRAG